MSPFEDELAKLKKREVEEEKARKALERERQEREESERKKVEQHYVALEEFAKLNIEPLLAKINMVYADRDGRISYQRQYRIKEESKRGMLGGKANVVKTKVYEVEVALTWAQWGEWPGNYGSGDYGAKDLSVVVGDESLTVIAGRTSTHSLDGPRGGGASIALVSRSDASWRGKLEQAFVSALASRQCEWSDSWDCTP